MTFADLGTGRWSRPIADDPPRSKAPPPGPGPRKDTTDTSRQRQTDAEDWRRAEAVRRRAEAGARQKAGTPMERALDAAFEGLDASRAVSRTKGIRRDAPADLLARARNAWPFPTDLHEARREHDAWTKRERDANDRNPAGSTLTAACQLRMEMVRELLMGGMPAHSAAEAWVRFEWLKSSTMMTWDDQEIGVVMADLQGLAAAEADAERRGTTASSRRKMLEDLLRNPTTTGLPDRDIARRVGVSPQTVGNARRRMAAQAPPKDTGRRATAGKKRHG